MEIATYHDQVTEFYFDCPKRKYMVRQINFVCLLI